MLNILKTELHWTCKGKTNKSPKFAEKKPLVMVDKVTLTDLLCFLDDFYIIHT